MIIHLIILFAQSPHRPKQQLWVLSPPLEQTKTFQMVLVGSQVWSEFPFYWFWCHENWLSFMLRTICSASNSYSLPYMIDTTPQPLFADDVLDDSSSQCSSASGKYSNLNYISSDENETSMSSVQIDQHTNINKIHNSSRFCPVENRKSKDFLGGLLYKQSQCAIAGLSQGVASRGRDGCKLTRNRSLVDVHSQLLHRSLVEEVNRRRLFKTVGAVESIGFQAPCEVSSSKRGSSRQPIGNRSSDVVRTRRNSDIRWQDVGRRTWKMKCCPSRWP